MQQRVRSTFSEGALRLFAVLICLFLVLRPACGQVNSATTDSARTSEAVSGLQNRATQATADDGRDPAARPSAGSGELLLRTNSGELVPLNDLLGVDYRSLLDELLNRGQQQLVVPRFEVSRLELSGRINRDVVSLTAELTIRVQPDHEWVTVPVAFSDMHIDDIAHTADAEHAQAIPETSDPSQKRWHLYGAGLHRIRLQLIGKSRPLSPTGHALNLNLPRATISHAVIQFSSPVELQKLPPDSVEQSVKDEEGVRAVEFWGLTPAFSMNWVDVVAPVSRKPVIQVQSNRMKLDLNSIPVALTGVQTLQISGSPVNELTILFPQGFLLLELNAMNQSGVSVLNGFEVSSESEGSSAAVRLTGPMEGLLTLTFEMELLNRTFPQDVQVRLPAIRNANAQSGDLDILIPPGLRVQQTRVEGAQRKRVASEPDVNVQATAFRLRSADSIIVLHVEEIQALYAVSPELVFEPDADNVLMTARFPVNVLTGSLLDLQVRWPGYSGGVWQLLPGTTQLVTDKQSRPLSLEPAADDTDSFKLTFPERQSGQFRVEFRAFVSIAALRSAGATLTSPYVESSQQEPVIITTLESDVYSLQPVNSETSRTLQPAPFQSTALSDTILKDRKAQAWLHSQPDVPLSFELIRQAPSVTTSMTVGLTPRESGIEVRQQILYQIEHSELSSLSFIVPEGVQPSVAVEGESERLRATLDTAAIWSFRLPAARRGTVRIFVDYLWQVSDNRDGEVVNIELPLVLPLPQTSDMVRCEVGADVASGLRVRDEQNWSPVFSDQFEAAWLITGPASSVPISWQRSVSLNPSNAPIFLMSRTRISISEAVTTTVAVFEKPSEEIIFRLPEAVRPESISINGRSLRDLDGKIFSVSQDGMVRWTVAVVRDASAAPRGEKTLPLNPGSETASGSSADNDSDVTVMLEIQTRERLSNNVSLYDTASFHRPIFDVTAPAVPTLWFFESQDDARILGRKASQTALTGFRDILPGMASGQTAADSRVEAILLVFPDQIRDRLLARMDDWTPIDRKPQIYFAMSDSGPLSVYLIPSVSLLLVSATTCVCFFSAMCVLRLPSLAVPLLFVVAAIPALYLSWPDWTVMLTPYVLMGILFGIVSLTFQRLASDRRLRLPGLSRSGEMLTVFGYTGFLSGASSVTGADAVITGGSETSAPSVR